MEHPLIYDSGRGPELVGTRTTVYNLIPYFLKPDRTESEIAALNNLTAEQVAAMRAYVFHHFAEVMAQHDRIEERIRRGIEAQNTPEFRDKVESVRKDFEQFQEWITERRSLGLPSPRELGNWKPVFQEWLARKLAAVAETA